MNSSIEFQIRLAITFDQKKENFGGGKGAVEVDLIAQTHEKNKEREKVKRAEESQRVGMLT